MPILKSPPKPPKNETLQLRIEEDTGSKLAKYAEFIEASESYVASEALRLHGSRKETILELNSKGGLVPTGTK